MGEFVSWHESSRKSQNPKKSLGANAVVLPAAEDMRQPPVFHSWLPHIHRRSAKTASFEAATQCPTSLFTLNPSCTYHCQKRPPGHFVQNYGNPLPRPATGPTPAAGTHLPNGFRRSVLCANRRRYAALATASQNPSALSSLISSRKTETRPAPPVAYQTTKPLPCSLFAGPCGPLLLEPLSLTTAFQSPSRLCLAPATTPATAVIPMLALTFIQSFTLLVVLPTGLMLYVRVSRHGIVSARVHSRRFLGAEYRSASHIPQQQVFAIRHRLRLDSLARAFAPLTVELFIVGFESNGNLRRQLLCTQRRALSSARFRLLPRRKLPAQAEVERTIGPQSDSPIPLDGISQHGDKRSHQPHGLSPRRR